MWRNFVIILFLLSQAFGQPMANNGRFRSNPGRSTQGRMGVGYRNFGQYKTPGSKLNPIDSYTI
jgi:hypothetical protein